LARGLGDESFENLVLPHRVGLVVWIEVSQPVFENVSGAPKRPDSVMPRN
jgi:hypothetical protein